MPVQRVTHKKLREVSYSANANKQEDLPRGFILRELHLQLECTPTIAAAANIAANIAKGAEWGVIKNIAIIANGSQVIKTFSGSDLFWQNYYWYGDPPQVTAGLLDTGTANPVIKSRLILPFWMPRSKKPFDTALDTSKMSDLKIEIQWGTFTDINTAATAWTTEPKLKVSAIDSFGVGINNSVWKNNKIQQIIPASNTGHQVRLPVGEIYRGFYINTIVDSLDSSAVLNNIKLKTGNTTLIDFEAEFLRETTRLRMGVHRPFNGTGYSKIQVGNANAYGAHYWVDLVTDGSLIEAFDTFAQNELNLEFDLNKVGTVTELNIIPQIIVPVRGNPGK